jgi:hypothetical protein
LPGPIALALLYPAPAGHDLALALGYHLEIAQAERFRTAHSLRRSRQPEQDMSYFKASVITLAVAVCGCADGNSQQAPPAERLDMIAKDPKALEIWDKSIRDCRADDEKACHLMETLRRCLSLPVDEALPPAACIRASRFE